MVSADESREQRLALFALAAVTLVALALRLYLYGGNPAWTDEVETRMHAFGPWDGPWQAARRGWPLTQGLGFFALWKLLALAGLGGRELRLPSVLLGAAAVPLVYLLARRWLSRRSALLAAAFLALSPLHIRYSREARAYALVTVEFISFAILLLRASDRPSPRRLASAAALGIFFGWTVYGGVLVAAAGWSTLWLQRRTRAIFAAAAVTLTMLAVPLVLALLGARGDGPTVPPTPMSLARAEAFLGWFGFGLAVPARAGVWLMPLLAVSGLIRLGRRARADVALLLAVAIVPVVVLAALPSRYPFFVRYAIQLAPLLAIGAAFAVDGAVRWIGPAVHVLSLLLLVAVAWQPISQLYHERWTAWDEVGRLISENAAPGDPVWVLVDNPPLVYWGDEEIAALHLDRERVGIKSSREETPDSEIAWSVQLIVPRRSPPAPCDEILFAARDSLTEPERVALGQGAHLSLKLRLPVRLRNAVNRAVFLERNRIDPQTCTFEPSNS